MQLVAYGAQDIYLTGNPQITFFKVVYRRHTNFSMEAIEQTWNGTEPSDSVSGQCTATISRNGDLVHRMYLEVDGTTPNGVQNPTATAITDIELEIGGQKIDKHTGQWMNVWSCLTEKNPTAYAGTTGTNVPLGTLYQALTGMGGACTISSNSGPLFVPLQFWFCRNPGLALPLIALQYHEVKVVMNHNFTAYSAMVGAKLWCDYIYLDTDERRRFAQVSHEYLIEQVQEQSLTASASTNTINFNHPVKELIWTKDGNGGGVATLDDGSSNPSYLLKLNGHDRFSARDFRYFTRTQIWQHHTGVGGINPDVTESKNGRLSDGIGVYSFALKPEEHQPSGTCNFSRIDTAQFVVDTGTSTADVMYAVNYNVLRIMSGMGGLAYSN